MLMAEQIYFAVVTIDPVELVYQGQCEWAAARKLEPGTVHGMGRSRADAILKARAVAVKIAKERKSAA
jgi:hypothetical protein